MGDSGFDLVERRYLDHQAKCIDHLSDFCQNMLLCQDGLNRLLSTTRKERLTSPRLWALPTTFSLKVSLTLVFRSVL